jgi:SSS family solute:Na+ symporter
MFRVHADAVDYAILAIYFVVVLGIGLVARRQVHTGLDFFLSGRSLPAWITGLAFIAANLGALEILGLAANGAKYGRPRSTSTGSGRSRPWCSSAS